MSSRKQYWAMVWIAAGALAAACDSETAGNTGTGGGTTTTATSTTTGTTTTNTGTTSTTATGGSGGGIDAQAVCDEGEQKILSCGGKFPGQGGAGGFEGFVDCDKTDVCRAQCAIDAPCDQIKYEADTYADCLGCCDNPQLC